MLFTIIVVGVCVIGSLAWLPFSLRRFRRRLHAVPRTAIGSLVAGTRVRVVGIARKLDGDVGGIFTGTPCLACQGWISSGADSAVSEPADRLVPFRVEDDTGSIVVEIGHATLELSGRSVDVASSKAFGSSIVARESRALAGDGLEYVEDRLDADTRVAVIGYVVRDDEGAVRLAGRDNDPLLITNLSDAFL